MTYAEIQAAAAQILRVKPGSVRTCWIAEVKREMGLTQGPAPNTGQGERSPLCPPKYKKAIRGVLMR